MRYPADQKAETHKQIVDIAAREFGVPMTIIDLDGLDLREYDDVQVKSRLDAFMETLAAT